ncbi:DUF6881 domain-containing protein [Paenibacillus pinihumi]|uniref:DUF6881 domain-containing protein n=1 Tax=Paenibacillus pinihumi TaxID=669462 RepID=UPI00040BA8C7|nr:hypothetical protein [Paenibacillus pinihumi]
MHYLYIESLVKSDFAPKISYLELGEDRYETRKIYIMEDDSIAYADSTVEYGDTGLSDRPIPEIEVIHRQGFDFAKEITKEEFETFWNKYVLGQGNG